MARDAARALIQQAAERVAAWEDGGGIRYEHEGASVYETKTRISAEWLGGRVTAECTYNDYLGGGKMGPRYGVNWSSIGTQSDMEYVRKFANAMKDAAETCEGWVRDLAMKDVRDALRYAKKED